MVTPGAASAEGAGAEVARGGCQDGTEMLLWGLM